MPQAAEDAHKKIQEAAAQPRKRAATRTLADEEDNDEDEDAPGIITEEANPFAGLTDDEMKTLQEALDKEDTSSEAKEEEKMAMTESPDEKKAACVLKKARMIVAYFRRSTQAMEELRKLYHNKYQKCTW